MSSTGWPSPARSGKPRESIRGRPVGCGHEPVVKVWPQKWKASESPGSIRVPTVRAAASATSAPPTLARNPRRDVSRASESVSRSRCSGTAPLGGGQHALQLGEVVEGALGENSAAVAQGDGDGERAAGNPEVAPERGVHDLVEDADPDVGIPGDVLDRGRQRLAEVAPLRAEHRETELSLLRW